MFFKNKAPYRSIHLDAGGNELPLEERVKRACDYLTKIIVPIFKKVFKVKEEHAPTREQLCMVLEMDFEDYLHEIGTS